MDAYVLHHIQTIHIYISAVFISLSSYSEKHEIRQTFLYVGYDSQMPTSFGGAGGFRPFFTCDKRPEICSTKGQFCCNRRCVDLKTDQYNCGRCGRTCNYSKICCEGKCVSPLSNEKHCGGCNNNCGKGSSCLYAYCDPSIAPEKVMDMNQIKA
ncbi:hypothetical protein PVK06_015304 [Gossypium arboreum]|uniref:Stigma-specific STIG1-like protein 1 n=1 Tax=Gossypium arboreum TaxID=29729 RepID=A0ABR0PWY1_GOSAR|nr:hypothetical protein PVK06_015304 [Gossypium arboreum]